MKKSITFILVLIAVGAMIHLCSCSTHKGMVRCPKNQEVYYAKRHEKMVECSRVQKGSKEIWLFNLKIK